MKQKKTKQSPVHVLPPPVKNEAWRDFFEAASLFQKAEPWKLPGIGPHTFAVGTEGTGDLAFLAVMGTLGTMFGLALYPGDESWEQACKTADDDRKSIVAGVANTDSIVMSYDRMEALSADEVRQYRAASFPFEGATQVPTIRSYRPGYYPWHPDEEEVRFVTYCLGVCIGVSGAIVRGQLNPAQMEEGLMVIEPKEPAEKEMVLGFVKRRRAARLRYFESGEVGDLETPAQGDVKVAAETVWEVGEGLFGEPMQDGGRPYFPRQVMLVDQESLFILGMKLLTPNESLAHELAVLLFEGLRQFGALPRELQVGRKDLAAALAPLGSAMGIRVTFKRSRPACRQAQRDFERHFGMKLLPMPSAKG